MYNYRCEYCDGIVREQIVAEEIIRHKEGSVVLEDVPVGVCDSCGQRYYHSSILKGVS